MPPRIGRTINPILRLLRSWDAQPSTSHYRCALEPLEQRHLLAADPIISEFQAANDSTLADEDGDFADWIEIYNAGDMTAQLDGWYLTDDAAQRTKWRLPDVSLPAGQFLLVFASGKDRDDPAATLHTSFRLAAGGEYLGLVQADGATVASEFAPAFPAQLDDTSYGFIQQIEGEIRLVEAGAAATALVPTVENGGDALGTTWTENGFDDNTWLAGVTGVGFELGVGYEELIGLDVGNAMSGVSGSVFVRVPFTVADPGAINALRLEMKYDDGFVAYLNGQEIGSRNAPELPRWDSLATAQHADLFASQFEEIDAALAPSLLRTGTNVLAIHGLNAGAASNDFLIVPKLVGTEAAKIEGDTPVVFENPTPGTINAGRTFTAVAAAPQFSLEHGVFETEQELTITTSTPGATLVYTTDGSVPHTRNGRRVTAPDEATPPATTLAIQDTTTLRVIVTKDDYLPSATATQTYVLIPSVANQPAAPAGVPTTWSGGFGADYQVDPDVVNNTLRDYSFEEALLSIPTLSVVTEPANLFNSTTGIYANSGQRGPNWERGASIELFYPDGRQGFQIDGGIQMHGNSSRGHGFTPKHSMRLLFKGEYGPKKLEYKVFENSDVTRFDELLLRGSSTDSWPVVDGPLNVGVQRWARVHATYFRDQWMRDAQNDMGHPSGHGTYVHLYLNGLYWGQYNLAERPGDTFNAENFGGEKEEYDVIKDFAEVETGNRTAWEQMISLANSGLASEAAYQRLQGNNPDGTPSPAFEKLLDVDNLIDYMILHIYSGAEDWPNHNWWAARRRGPDSEGFRFFVWDQEISNDSLVRQFTLFDTRFEDPISSPSPSFLYGKLMENATFHQLFTDRVQKHLFNGGLLTPEANAARWLARQTEIDQSMVAESARWGDSKRGTPYKREVEWLAEMDWMRDVYWPRIHEIALSRFRRVGLFPDTLAPDLTVDGVARPGGRVETGAQLELADPNDPSGTIYYTLDGADPQQPEQTLQSTVLIDSGTEVQVTIPVDDRLAATWTEIGFDASGWLQGGGGVGYERATGYESQISVDVESDMYTVNGTAYIRVPFQIEQLRTFDRLDLRMKYDDGFVAFLNGVEVASRNAPEGALDWDSGATRSHSDALALTFEDVDISEFQDLLRVGENVLAIQGLNAGANSSDFLILPELVGQDVSGSVSPSAIAYDGPITLDADTHLKTRVLRGVGWSALVDVQFSVETPLRITELMYHPADPAPGGPYIEDDFEFIELQNIGTSVIDLSGVRITDGVDFDFSNSAITSLEPGGFVLVVSNQPAFESRYGRNLPVAGEFDRQLSNSGERLVVLDAFAETVQDFAYSDAWYPDTDGTGRSLVVVDTLADPAAWNGLENWRASFQQFGSPGGADQAPVLGDTNGDGVVDLDDLNNVRNHFGAGGLGDTDGDGDVDIDDLNNVRNNFGAQALRVMQLPASVGEALRPRTRPVGDERAVEAAFSEETFTTAGDTRIVEILSDDPPRRRRIRRPNQTADTGGHLLRSAAIEALQPWWMR